MYGLAKKLHDRGALKLAYNKTAKIKFSTIVFLEIIVISIYIID